MERVWRINALHWCRYCSYIHSGWCHSFSPSGHLSPSSAIDLGFPPNHEAYDPLWFPCYLLCCCASLEREPGLDQWFVRNGLRDWARRYYSNFSKSSSITLTLQIHSLKKVTVMASGISFITPRPTHLKWVAVMDLELISLNAQIKELLKHQPFEEDQRINSPSASITFAFLCIALVKQWTKWFP